LIHRSAQGTLRQMRNINGTLKGDQVLTDEMEFHGIATGDFDVQRGGRLVLHGMVSGTLTVHKGGRAIVHGTVGKHAINRGGSLEIFGTVSGTLHQLAGETRVSAKADIGERA
jgi:hypothetical protein